MEDAAVREGVGTGNLLAITSVLILAKRAGACGEL